MCAVALVEAGRANHDGAALVAAFVQFVAQFIAVVKVRYGVAVFGKTGDALISQTCAQRNHQIIVADALGFSTGAFTGRVADNFFIYVNGAYVTLDETDVVVFQGGGQVHSQ